MAGFVQFQHGDHPRGGPPVPPPQHPGPLGGRQQSAPMGVSFQQRPVDPRTLHRESQGIKPQPLRPLSQPADCLPQQRPYPDFGSPRSQRSFPFFQDVNDTGRTHDLNIPHELGQFTEIVDLTAATITEEQYFQHLSKPIAIRFEKVEPQIKYDSAGERVKSTWLSCTRSRLPNVDAVQANDEIQRLNKSDNKKGLTLIKKTQALGSNAQTQIKKAERDLLADLQDQRFCVVLKQLDWTERPVIEHTKKGSKRNSKKKPRKERASITAYFSECPKPDQLPSALYYQLRMEKSQGQTQLNEQRREREMTAHRVREDRAREDREYEKMAEQNARRGEAATINVLEQKMTSQQQQQRPGSQQMQPNQPILQGHQVPHPQGRPSVPQHQTEPAPGPALAPGPHGHPLGRAPMSQPGPGPQGYAQGHPPMALQQSGPLPHGYAQGRPPMAPQSGSVPQQHPQFQPNNGHHQFRPQQPADNQGQAIRQTAPQQGQHVQSQNIRQMPPQPPQGAFVRAPNGEFNRQPSSGNTNRPIITVVSQDKKLPKHKRSHLRFFSSSSDSSSENQSIFDSDSDHSSASTKHSSLGSSSTGSPHMARALPTKPKKPTGRVGMRYIVEPDDLARGTRPPVTRRHAKAYIQTASERNIKVPGLPPRGPSVDALTQVREAYLAGHEDHERLVSEVDRLEASARKYQPARRLSRSETFSGADGLSTFPSKYAFRRLSSSDTQRGQGPILFQDEGLPRFRRVTPSEAGRELNRERARDFGGDFSPWVRTAGRDRDLRYDDRDLEHDFAARVRIGDERLNDRSFQYDDRDRYTFRERERQRDLLARDEHEEILKGIDENARGQSLRWPNRDPFINVPQERRYEDRFEARADFGPRGRP